MSSQDEQPMLHNQTLEAAPEFDKSALEQENPDPLLTKNLERNEKRWLLIKWIREPFAWLAMLGRELNVSFVSGVIVVYGMSQGFGGAMYRVAGGYYWKDVQRVQPSALQFYRGIISIGWQVKPLWGILTDSLPFFGYYRRPYFVFAGFMGVLASLILVCTRNLHAAIAVLLMAITSTSAAIGDVTIDAVAAQRSREFPGLASDIQSLCSTCISAGQLLGYMSSGVAVSALNPQGALGLQLIPPLLFIVIGFSLHEQCLPRQQKHKTEIGKTLWDMSNKMISTLKLPVVWRPTLYMFLSWAIAPDTNEGKFFFFTDSTKGLGFSQEFMGVIYAAGSVGSLLGVMVYHKMLRGFTFRWLLFWAHVLTSASGMLDLMLITGANKKLHIPDYIFVIIDEGISRAVLRLRWIPLLVLSAKLCPANIEGTFFALLMSIDNVSILLSSWGGGVLLKVLNVTRDNFNNLWLAVVVRSLLVLSSVVLLCFVPATDQSIDILPAESSFEDSDGKDEESIQLVETGSQSVQLVEDTEC